MSIKCAASLLTTAIHILAFNGIISKTWIELNYAEHSVRFYSLNRIWFLKSNRKLHT